MWASERKYRGWMRNEKDIPTVKPRRIAGMPALAPAALLALFAAWCGTFPGGATFWGSALGIAALLGFLFLSAPTVRWGPAALWLAVAASTLASPVPRAGWMAVVLLPAFLALPGAVARAWSREEDRRRGLRVVSLVVALVALWGLIDFAVRDLPRAAMPLGHHNLLAVWLAALLPLALIPARERGPWRWMALGSALLAAGTILATRSLAGAAALAFEAVVALILVARVRWGWILLAIAALVVTQAPRIAEIASGEDLSMRARAVYYEAAWDGIRARPLLGWGPGSVAWTAADFWEPVPGVNPWGEILADLHSLPLQVGYELGLAGLLLSLVLAGVFLRRRIADMRAETQPILAGLVGLGGAAIAALGGASLAVTALPLAFAVCAGAALSVGTREPGGSRLPLRLYAVAAGLLLFPTEAARLSYDQAVARPEEALPALERAVRLDPSFPLYRMQLALRQPQGGNGAADQALRAARDGRAVGTLWTVAGTLGFEARRPWASDALARACALDPLSPFPPFFRMALSGEPKAGAHALLAEPRLAAATIWEDKPDLFPRSLKELRQWPGVEKDLKNELIAVAPRPEERRGETGLVHLDIDTDPEVSLALYAFRRRPFPASKALIEVRINLVQRLALPPATSHPTSARDAFRGVCKAPLRSPREQSMVIP